MSDHPGCVEQLLENPFEVFWGGPGHPPRHLRNVLEDHVRAVPSGGEILWVTYYFRDEALAAALRDAASRGVRVRVVMEGDPRTGAVNSNVRRILQSDPVLGRGGLRAIKHRLVDNRFLRRCRLHEKLYYFSHPVPSVLVGTFNPSGNQLEDPEIIREIGDQDRGHNVLVKFRMPGLVNGLYAHADRLMTGRHGPWERFLKSSNRVIRCGKTRVLFFPRVRWRFFDELFLMLSTGSTLRVAVSHLNDREVCNRLLGLAARGVRIEILTHDTARRVPSWVEKTLQQEGITFTRYAHPDGWPMHNKFMLLDTPDQRVLAFGSLNLSVRSLHANHEILVIDENPELYDAFDQRWQDMMREVREMKTSRTCSD